MEPVTRRLSSASSPACALAIALSVTGALTGLFAGGLAAQLPPAGRLAVTVLAVGHGDAVLVEPPAGAPWLVDGGPDGSTFRRAVLPRLAAAHAALGTFVLSHPHADHLGGAVALLAARRPDLVLDPGYADPAASYGRLLALVESRTLTWRAPCAGESPPTAPGWAVDVLWPPARLLRGTGADANNNGLVLRLRHGRVRILLCADVEREALERLVAETDLRCDALKVPHHGSFRSFSPAFARATGARLALFSCDGGARHGLPDARVLAGWKEAGARVLRTDCDGDLRLVSDGLALRIETGK